MASGKDERTSESSQIETRDPVPALHFRRADVLIAVSVSIAQAATTGSADTSRHRRRTIRVSWRASAIVTIIQIGADGDRRAVGQAQTAFIHVGVG